METARKSRALAITILLVVFAVGIGAGVGGTFYYFKWEQEKRAQRNAENREKSPAQRMEERLVKVLELSEEQLTAMRPELERFGVEIRELREESRLEFRGAYKLHSETIKGFLDSEQLEAYEEYLERRTKHWNGGGKSSRNRSDATSDKPAASTDDAPAKEAKSE